MKDVDRGGTDRGRDVVYGYARCDGGRCAVKPQSNSECSNSRAIGEDDARKSSCAAVSERGGGRGRAVVKCDVAGCVECRCSSESDGQEKGLGQLGQARVGKPPGSSPEG